MQKKYELTDETRTVTTHSGLKFTLHRIRALRDFSDVKTGDLGGFIGSSFNLSHEGNCWVYDNAMVYSNGEVYGNARVRDKAQIHGMTCLYDDVVVSDDANLDGLWNFMGDVQVSQKNLELYITAPKKSEGRYSNDT